MGVGDSGERGGSGDPNKMLSRVVDAALVMVMVMKGGRVVGEAHMVVLIVVVEVK